ncbi:MAG: ABC transporter permease [Rhodospirillales bacterium]
MRRLILQKCLRAVITIWLCVTFVFVILRLSGDPAMTILPIDLVTPEVQAEFRDAWGLADSLPVQYWRYFANIFQGDMGFSFRDGRPAIEVVAERLPKTLQLLLISAIVTLALGIPAGIYAALHKSGLGDRSMMLAAVLGYSVPNFFLGVLLILVFSVVLRVLPSSGSGSWEHLIMPVICMSAAWLGIFARFTRSAMLDVLNQDYVRAARARGLLRGAAIWRHALPNAAIPTVTLAGLYLGGLIVNSLVVESVFAWPGIGRLLVDSVANRDLAVVQVIVLLAAVSMVVANLAVDLAYGWLDPRIRDAPSGV